MASPVGVGTLTFLGMTCITFIIGGVSPTRLASQQCACSLLSVSPLLNARHGGYRALVTAKTAVLQGNSDSDQFGEAIMHKLISEISARPPRRLAGTE